MRIALTGAGGFLGQAATHYFSSLAGVQEVRALYSPASILPSVPMPKVKTYQGDLCDSQIDWSFLDGADAVLHFANRGYPADKVARQDRVITENLTATGNLLEEMRARRLRKILYASTAGAIYRPVKPIPAPPFLEGAPVAFRSAYAVYKVATEEMLSLYQTTHGFQPYILRISNPYGAGQFGRVRQGFIGVAMARAFEGKPIEVWGSVEIGKDFLYINDLLTAVDAFVSPKREIEPGIYHVASGVTHSLDDVLNGICRVTGIKIAVELHEARATDMAWIALDISKIKAKTGWHPTHSLESGLRKTWNTIQQLNKIKRSA